MRSSIGEWWPILEVVMALRALMAVGCAAFLVACGADSDDGPAPDPASAGASGAAGAQGSPLAGSAPVDTAGVPGTAGTAGADAQQPEAGAAGTEPVAGNDAADPDPDPAPTANAGCDADPHRPDCIDTHVRGQCNIDSGYPGDEACLLPPPPDEGIQIHIGPENYDDMAAIAPFLFSPGNESSECWYLNTPNTEDIHYQSYVLSGRDGTHHIINTGYATPHAAGTGTAFAACRFGGGADLAEGRIPGASKAYMPRFPVAPENENLGYPMTAQTPMTSDMHYFNYTTGDILREYWLNLYTVPKEQVEESALRIRGYGGLGFNITPGTDMVYNYSCPIDAPGRIISMLGHTHSHAVRFTAWVNRNTLGERVKVFEAYDYLEPQIYAFNSIEQNPPFSDSSPGGWTGILEVDAGDTLEWECHVINDSEYTLGFTNFVDRGEMCNIWGESVGPRIDCNRF